MSEELNPDLEKFFEKIGLSCIAKFFKKYTVEEIYEVEERDLPSIVYDKEFIKERIKLRNFLFSSKVSNKNGFNAFNLRTLIEYDPKTKYLPQRENQVSKLDLSECNAVCSVIVREWFKDWTYKVGIEDYNYAWTQIKSLFPMELKATFIGHEQKRGKLQEKVYYHNKQRAAKKKKASLQLVASPRANDDLFIPDDPNPVDDTPDFPTALDFLEKNVGPIDKAEAIWTKFFEDIKHKKIVITDFKILQSCDGHRLYTLHFNMLFEDKSDRLILMFPSFKIKMLPHLKKNVKDQKSREFIALLMAKDDNFPESTENYLFFQALHGYLVPVAHYDHKLKKNVRFSITNSREFFITTVRNLAEMQVEINKHKAYKAKKKLTLQPMIFAIMPEEYTFSKFIVLITDVSYEFQNLLEAVTCAFVSHYTLHLGFMDECDLIWTFIQRYFFDIDNPEPENSEQTNKKKSDKQDSVKALMNLL
ncbi:hypothetical protein ACFFRR_007067 [Megaselia abdita]